MGIGNRSKKPSLGYFDPGIAWAFVKFKMNGTSDPTLDSDARGAAVATVTRLAQGTFKVTLVDACAAWWPICSVERDCSALGNNSVVRAHVVRETVSSTTTSLSGGILVVKAFDNDNTPTAQDEADAANVHIVIAVPMRQSKARR